MRKILIVCFFCLSISFVKAQVEGFKSVKTPIPPTVSRMLEYGNFPMNEYNGKAIISIPVYKIEDGTNSIPLKIGYQSDGIKVAEEASWVGLGWQMNLPQIVQVVNGMDDLGSATKMLPDYIYNAVPDPIELMLCSWRRHYSSGPCIESTYPENPQQSNQISQDYPWPSHVITTGSYFPINRNYAERPYAFFNRTLGESNQIDSEPDIFRASINGESFTFVMNWDTKEFEVLDRKDYLLTPILNNGNYTFQVTDPLGTKYLFESASVNTNAISISKSRLRREENTFLFGANSRIFHITKIVSLDGKTISFNYEEQNILNNFKSFNQTYYDNKVYQKRGAASILNGYFDDIYSKFCDFGYSFTTSNETRKYLKSISTNFEKILFYRSQRIDVSQDFKLDSIVVSNVFSKNTHAIRFGYDYYIGKRTVGGGFYDSIPNIKNENEKGLRLRLKYVKIDALNPYQFTYNKMQLPNKDSYAVDYWGYYNGKDSNNSFIANPSEVGQTLSRNEIKIINNSRIADSSAIKAGILTEVIYSTGGKSFIEYELNEFTSNSDVIQSKGQGLRVKSITNFDIGRFKSKRKFIYEGGVDFSPLKILKDFSCSYRSSNTPTFSIEDITSKRFSSNNYCAPSLQNGGGGGYSKVTIIELDSLGKTNGKVVKTFSNNPDITLDNNSLPINADNCASPNTIPNGLELETCYYDNNSRLVNKLVYNYTFKLSPVFYGVTHAYFRNFFSYSYQGDDIIYDVPRYLLVYNPIFAKQVFLSSSKKYTITGSDTIKYETKFKYNVLGLKYSETFTDDYNYYNNRNKYYGYANESNDPNTAKLWTLHYWHPVKEGILSYNGMPISSKVEEFNEFEGLNLLSKVYTTNQSLVSKIETYDKYDSKGNILEKTEDTGIKKSYLWGYNGTLPIASVSNGSCKNIGYTSFELDNNGTIPINKDGILPDNNSFSGVSVYDLQKTSIVWSRNCTVCVPLQVTYWLKENSGSTNISNCIKSEQVTSKQGWVKFRHYLDSQATSFTLSGNAKIDELRIFPSGSLMKTYIYKPGIGVTQIIDENEKSIKYYYDKSGRFEKSLDENGKILQQNKYSMIDYIVLDSDNFLFPFYKSSKKNHFEVGGTWSATPNESWITLDKNSGTSEESFLITCAENNTSLERYGSVSISQGSIKKQINIVQDYSGSLSVSNSNVTISKSGTAVFVKVAADPSWYVHSVNASNITAIKVSESMLSISCVLNDSAWSTFGIVTLSNGKQTINIYVTQLNN